jgi:hypothetical protein
MPLQAENILSTHATRRQVRTVLSKLPAIATGSVGGSTMLMRSLLVRIGLTALAHIRDAFVVKARGGTDETGLKWKPLSPYTIAYRRRHPGLPKKRSRLTHPSWMLKEKERKRWWKLYSRFLAMYKGDKSHAAAHAWFILKEEGAQTILSVYGNTRVEILRDTGLLLNSLTPGIDPIVGIAPSTPPRTPHQVFRLGQGEVVIGTNRKWCGTHHRGVPGRIPKRPLWPDPKKWPSSWWRDILGQAREGLVDIALHLLR